MEQVDSASGGTFRGVLAARRHILALCRPNTVIIPGHGKLSSAAELVRGDVRDPNRLRESLSGVDIIFHLAATNGAGRPMEAILRSMSAAQSPRRPGAIWIQAHHMAFACTLNRDTPQSF